MCFYLKILGGGGHLWIIFFLHNTCILSGGDNVRWWVHSNPLHSSLIHRNIYIKNEGRGKIHLGETDCTWALALGQDWSLPGTSNWIGVISPGCQHLGGSASCKWCETSSILMLALLAPGQWKWKICIGHYTCKIMGNRCHSVETCHIENFQLITPPQKRTTLTWSFSSDNKHWKLIMKI